jgi:mRNA-degrading endonuclease RelE of RelBE toxin-antitoxin system
MKLDYTPHFKRSYFKAQPRIQQAFDKQSALLLQDLRHPSLRAKKYDASQGLWQARVTGDWRFYFQIVGDTYRLEEIRAHPK